LWNFGTKTNAQFSQDSSISNWGNINVTPAGGTFGYSQPYIRKDSAGNMLLYVGSVSGYVYEYLIDPVNLRGGAFALLDSNVIGQGVGSMATISIADINNDGKLEYLMGNGRGGLLLYSDSLWDPSTILGLDVVQGNSNKLQIHPNPAQSYLACTPQGGTFINPQTEIYNILGQNIAVQNTFTGNRVIVNTSGLSGGFYVVRIIDAGKIYTAKFMVAQ
jgi:hypothetical protein